MNHIQAKSFLFIQFVIHFYKKRASLVVHMVKNLPSMQETGVQSLGWEDPLEKGMAAHPSILAWKNPRTEEPGCLVHGVTKSWTQLCE